MATELYTAEPAFPARFHGMSELASLIAGGPSAVRDAAARGAEYTLTIEPVPARASEHEFRVRVRPALKDVALSLRIDVDDVPFELLVTVVYKARLHADNGVSRLNLPGDLYSGVQRLINNRTSENDVCVFVSAMIDNTHRPFPPVLAWTSHIVQALRESRLASERTMLVVGSNQIKCFGSPMFEGSEIFVGNVRDFPWHSASADEMDKMDVQTLFEGGAWAIHKNDASTTKELSIAGDPPLTLRVRTSRGPDGHATCVWAYAEDDSPSSLELLAVHSARRDAAGLLLSSQWLREYADPVVALMRQHVERGSSEMVIFATPCKPKIADAGAWRTTLRRVLRTLYDLKLTAHEENKDALVIVRVESHDEVLLEASRLLYLIDGARSLFRREIGAPKKRNKMSTSRGR